MIRQRRLLLGSLLAAWLGMILACGGGGEKSESRPGHGEAGVIYIPGLDDVAVAIDPKTYDEWIKASVAKDQVGITNLLLSERVLIMPARTKVLVLGPGVLSTEVRILDGPYAGRSGIIGAEWVHAQ